ncbi:MAG: glucosaminidase domain-containing protein [Chloroflexi bacterium]|nr:glucosaminidase domain-containing protein [Chloroflexota bacterium]
MNPQPATNVTPGDAVKTSAAAAAGDATRSASAPLELHAIDNSSPEAFVRSITPYAAQLSRETGIPVGALVGMACNETGYGRYAAGNNLFGIKGTGPAGSITSRTWEDYGQGPVTINDSFRAYHDPGESFRDFGQLITTSPRYAGAVGQDSVPGFVGAIIKAGYATDPTYVQKITSIAIQYQPVIDDALQQQAGPAAPSPTTLTAANSEQGVVVPDQFHVGLPPAEAYAACGPVAAIAFAQAYGRNPSVSEVMDLAKASGWTVDGGMNGIANEKRLLDSLGLPARLEDHVDWTTVQSEVDAGNPVIFSTPKHYFVADRYDPARDAYHVGQSGLALRGGSAWLTASQIAGMGNGLNGALYTQHPLASQNAVGASVQTPSGTDGPGVALSGTSPAAPSGGHSPSLSVQPLGAPGQSFLEQVRAMLGHGPTMGTLVAETEPGSDPQPTAAQPDVAVRRSRPDQTGRSPRQP